MLTTGATDANPSCAFVSRVFAPEFGLYEDPVTGSAQCVLAPYWHTKLGLAPGAILAARQVSRRGGDVDIVWDAEGGVCQLRGSAVVASEGQMHVPLD